MNTLRKIGKIITGFLFTLALLVTLSVYSLVGFTEFGTIEDVVGGLFADAPEGTPGTDFGGAESLINSLKDDCDSSGSDAVQLKTGLSEVTVKCSDIRSLNQENFRDFASSTVAQTLYNKNYGCDFVTCLREGEDIMPLIITKLAHDFYSQVLGYAVAVTIVLGILFVITVEGIKSKFKSLGFSLLWISVPFFLMSLFMERLTSSFVPTEIFSRIQPVLDTFFAPTFLIYVYLMVAGVALVSAGYLIKPETLRLERKT